eukprot:scaffold1482_cov120-Cylindrotheca_fusiformis.AAC.1
MQIAFFAVAKIPKAERGDHPFARKTCELLFRGKGRNLPGFMVGRQMTVTLCFFIIARVTTLDIEVGVDDNIFGVSDGIQEFFNLGFLGAIITTILASIAWQLVASAFPIAFLSNPIVYIMLRIVLLIEATGICSGAWFLGMIHKKVAGFQLDEVYVGTAEERAAGQKPDHSIHAGRDFTMGTNVLNDTKNYEEAIANLSAYESFSQRRERIVSNIRQLRTLAENSSSEAEMRTYQDSIDMEVKALTKLNEEEAKEKKAAGMV